MIELRYFGEIFAYLLCQVCFLVLQSIGHETSVKYKFVIYIYPYNLMIILQPYLFNKYAVNKKRKS